MDEKPRKPSRIFAAMAVPLRKVVSRAPAGVSPMSHDTLECGHTIYFVMDDDQPKERLCDRCFREGHTL